MEIMRFGSHLPSGKSSAYFGGNVRRARTWVPLLEQPLIQMEETFGDNTRYRGGGNCAARRGRPAVDFSFARTPPGSASWRLMRLGATPSRSITRHASRRGQTAVASPPSVQSTTQSADLLMTESAPGIAFARISAMTLFICPAIRPLWPQDGFNALPRCRHSAAFRSGSRVARFSSFCK